MPLQIVQKFQNNVPQCKTVQTSNIPSSMVHNTKKKDSENLETSLCTRDTAENQYWMAMICTENRDDSIREIKSLMIIFLD